MIDKSSVIKTVLERVTKLSNGHYLDLRTYKRNRSVLIVKREHDLLVIEDGFFKEDFVIDVSKLKNLLKVLIKREFPRSNKIRLYTMGQYDPDVAAEVKRKKI